MREYFDLRAVYSGAGGSGDLRGGGGGRPVEAVPGGEDAARLHAAGAGGASLWAIGAGVVAGSALVARTAGRVGGWLAGGYGVVRRGWDAIPGSAVIGRGAQWVGRFARPLGVVGSAAAVTLRDQHLVEGGFADGWQQHTEARMDELRSHGVAGRVAGVLVSPGVDGSVVVAAAGEETVRSVVEAVRVVSDPDAEGLSKVGAVLDAMGAPVTGALVGGRAVVERRVARHFEGVVARDNATGQARLREMFADRIDRMTPDQQEAARAANPTLAGSVVTAGLAEVDSMPGRGRHARARRREGVEYSRSDSVGYDR